MAETSFADRLGRARSMHAAIDSFDPAFVPVDSALLPATFATTLDGLETLNAETDDLVDQYTTGVGDRNAILADLRARAGRVLSLVNSNKAWARYQRTVKAVVDKIRGNRPPAAKPPTGNETAEQAKKRNQGARSHAEMESHLNRLIAAVQKIPDYAPPAAELSLPELQALHAALHAQNLTMNDLEQDTAMKQRERYTAYNGPDGLKAQMKAIKAAVRAQYGGKSPEYEAVKGIGL